MIQIKNQENWRQEWRDPGFRGGIKSAHFGNEDLDLQAMPSAVRYFCQFMHNHRLHL
jgi:hypothetical protein